MGDGCCVLCSSTGIKIRRNKYGYSEIVEENPRKPNAIINLETESLFFGICGNPGCHKKLSQYLYDNVLDKNSSNVVIEYQGKKYKFPVDRRIINSLPNKLKDIINGVYKNGK